jgi:DNA-binding NtrC family response regulator
MAQVLHKSLSPDALELLAAQPWPGNIRELRNVLEQATLMTDDLVLHVRHFAAALRLAAPAGADGVAGAIGGAVAGETAAAARGDAAIAKLAAELPAGDAPQPLNAALAPAARPGPQAPASQLRPLAEQVNEVEDAAITAALEATGGNRVAAARILRMSRAALYAKLARQPRRIVVTR